MNRSRFMFLVFSLALWAEIFLPVTVLAETAEKKLPESCRQLPSDGDCKALLSIAYYDQDRNACDETFYGGCGGVVPFQDISDCRAACETGEALRMTEFRKVSNAPLARIQISFPAVWDESALHVFVNDIEAEYSLQGQEGTSRDEIRELIVQLGHAPTRKLSVAIVVNGRTYTAFTPLYW